jgi:ADP-heptose:LPS heptosyltransferase
MNVDRSSVRRLLIIKLRAIGDVLLSTIVIPNLRRAFPEASIEFLTEPPAAPIILKNPLLDDVIVFDRSSVGGTWLVREVRRRHYDLVIDLFGNPRTALVTRLSGAQHRVGFGFRGRAYAYSRIVKPRGGEVHNTQFNLDALEAIGVPIVDRRIHFPVSPQDIEFAEHFFAFHNVEEVPVVALNSGGGWYTKRWGVDRFAELGNRLSSEYHVKILLVWGPGELADVESIRSMLTFEPLMPPVTSLGQMAALLQRCSLMITNDSGPMHMGASLGTPVVGIYGPTNPDLQGPYGVDNVIVRNEYLHCLGCNLTKCPVGIPCMKGLQVDRVLEAARSLLGRREERSSL